MGVDNETLSLTRILRRPKDYYMWSLEVRGHLRAEGLWRYVAGVADNSTREIFQRPVVPALLPDSSNQAEVDLKNAQLEEFLKMDAKAKNLINSTIAREKRRLVKCDGGSMTARDLWDKIEATFGVMTAEEYLKALKAFHTCTLRAAGGDYSKYIDTFNKARFDLRVAAHGIARGRIATGEPIGFDVCEGAERGMFIIGTEHYEHLTAWRMEVSRDGLSLPLVHMQHLLRQQPPIPRAERTDVAEMGERPSEQRPTSRHDFNDCVICWSNEHKKASCPNKSKQGLELRRLRDKNKNKKLLAAI